MSGAETLGTTIMKQQLQKKHLVKKRSLNRFCVDVENAFGHALRIVIGWKKLLEYLNEPSHLYK